MQNTIIKEFQNNPRVVTAVYQEGGRFSEIASWVRTFWSNYYLRGTVLWDERGAVGGNYRQPSTGLPFGRGFIIDQEGIVALPYFGHRPEMVIDTIYSLLTFIRGDANGDGSLDISDAVTILIHLFAGGATLSPRAADANDDGALNISDAVYVLDYLFTGGPEPPPPFPEPG